LKVFKPVQLLCFEICPLLFNIPDDYDTIDINVGNVGALATRITSIG